jgi:carbon-monoxide dehydrogenase iron sulfur subunit
MDKTLIVDTDRCTGCKICELVCSMTKFCEFNPRKAYIRVVRDKDLDLNLVTLNTRCDGCSECIKWCMPEAIKFVDSQEAVLRWKGFKFGSLPAPVINLE